MQKHLDYFFSISSNSEHAQKRSPHTSILYPRMINYKSLWTKWNQKLKKHKLFKPPCVPGPPVSSLCGRQTCSLAMSWVLTFTRPSQPSHHTFVIPLPLCHACMFLTYNPSILQMRITKLSNDSHSRLLLCYVPTGCVTHAQEHVKREFLNMHLAHIVFIMDKQRGGFLLFFLLQFTSACLTPT